MPARECSLCTLNMDYASTIGADYLEGNFTVFVEKLKCYQQNLKSNKDNGI